MFYSLVRLRNELLHTEPHDSVSCSFSAGRITSCGALSLSWKPLSALEPRDREEEFRCKISEREAGAEDLMALKQRQAILYEIQESDETSSFYSRAAKTAKSAPKTQSNMMGRPALSGSYDLSTVPSVGSRLHRERYAWHHR